MKGSANMTSPTCSSSLSTSTDPISSSSVSLAPFVNVCRADATKRKTFPKVQNFVTSPYLQSPILPQINSKNKTRKRKPKTISKPLLKQKRSSTVTISKPLTNSPQSCNITLKFLGWRPASCSSGLTHQITLFQQHCGGNPVIVYRGRLQQGDSFSFTSRRRHGFPFSITIYVDSLLDLKVSVCCEYKHRQGCVLGGPKGHFTLVSVEGSFPCYRCQLMKSQFCDRKRDRITSEQRLSVGELSLQSDDLETSPTNDYEDDFEDDEERTQECFVGEFCDKLKSSASANTVYDCQTLDVTPEPVVEHFHIQVSEFGNSVDLCKQNVTGLNGYVENEDENEQSNEEEIENKPVKSNDDSCAFVSNSLINEERETSEINIEASETDVNTSSPVNSFSLTSPNGSVCDNNNQISDSNSHISNDDAETSLTSPSDDSDDDVICPNDDVYGVNIIDDKHYKNPSGSDWIVVDDRFEHSHAIKQWTDYRDSCHQQFDSSDEEEESRTPMRPPLVTIMADVHAIESPRKETD